MRILSFAEYVDLFSEMAFNTCHAISLTLGEL